MRLAIKRQPVLYAATSAAAVLVHGFLCYRAAVCRGYPPLKPDELIAVFIAPSLMLAPGFFDDARNEMFARWVRSGWVALGFCFIWGIVAVNLESGRPSLGHLTGATGVVANAGPCVLVKVVLYLVPATMFFFCLDGVALGMWTLIRRFRDDGESV